ncbi:MAG TPA: hypothetical protein VFW07_04860 [Parafilimonas sp.]|nr:hypothetical protein [Parafilimonas sp.]
MNAPKKNFTAVIILFFIFSKNTFAQNIINKRIAISSGYDVRLEFSGEIKGSQFNPNGASNSFANTIVGDHIILRSTVKNFEPITLIIDEGTKKHVNTHTFVLMYKDSIGIAEQFYDFSTKEKIEAAIAAAKLENEKSITQTPSPQPVAKSSSTITESPDNQSTTQALTAEEIDRRFSELKGKANRAFNEKKYDEALSLYDQALKWKPADVFCNVQIESIKQMKQVAIETSKKNKDTEIRNLSYNSHIRKADSAFAIKEWDIARLEYTRALKDSAKDTHAPYKLKQIDNIVAEESYQSAMDIGKGYLTAHDFDKATLAFKEAIKIKPGDAEATRQLNSIKSLKDADSRQQAQLERNKAIEKQYKDTVDYADNAFEAGLWKTARQKYNSALKIKKDDLHVKNQIAKIDSMENLQQQEYSQRRNDSITNEKYMDARKRGDDALAAKNYNEALKAYQLAHVLKPSEPYPGAQISQIEIIQTQAAMQLQEEKNRKRREDSISNLFKSFVNKSDAARSKKDYTLANTYIIQALDLKPGDENALKKSKEINDVLAVIEKDRKYEMFVSIGDSLIFKAKDPDASLRWYDSAIALKPQESEAKNQYNLANYMILQRDSIKMEEENQEAFNKAFNEAVIYFKNGETARTEKRYGEAYTAYTLFLNKVEPFNRKYYSPTQNYYIKQANEYSKRLASFKINHTTVDEVKAQYPNIDFSRPPADQLFSSQRLDSSKQNTFIRKEIISKSPRINIVNNMTDKLRITCQSINFKEQYIYFRFAIKNSDTSAFLTGPMMLSVAKKNNQTNRVLPLFISDFPIVLPMEEKTFAYVIPVMLLWNDETLSFEVSGRTNTKKMSLTINEVIFNMERKQL